MSLTKVSYSMITGAMANVIDFGADPSGTSDCTAAFQAAFATGKAVYLPIGTYRVDSPISTDASVLNSATLIGETESHTSFSSARAVIDLTNNTQHFGSFGYNFLCRHIAFKNGKDIFRHTSNGSDGNVTKLIDCFATEFSGKFWTGFSAGNGSWILWDRPQLVSSLTTSRIFDTGTDFDNLCITGGWIETASALGFQIYGGTVTVRDTRFIPYASAGSTWFYFYDFAGSVPYVLFDGCIFGSESGREIAHWRANGGNLTFRNSSLYGIAGAIGVRLISSPDFVAFDACNASSNPTNTLYVDPTMTAAQALKFSACPIYTQNCTLSFSENLARGNSALVNSRIAGSPTAVDNHASYVASANMVAMTSAAYQVSGSSTNVTETTGVADIFGTDPNSYSFLFTTTAGGSGFRDVSNGPGISTLADGEHTFEVLATVTDGSCSLTLSFGGSLKTFRLGTGTHRVCLPMTFLTNTPRAVGIYFSGPESVRLTVSRMKIFKGQYSSRDHSMQGSAAPTGATLAWVPGDRLVNSVPTVGQPKAWTCTVAGAPGTWVSEGNL